MSDLKNLLPDSDKDWIWYDDDPSVAWDVPESYHGKLGEVFKAAGWERCYHRDHAVWHFNVKIRPTQEAWKYLSETIDKIADEYKVPEQEVRDRFQNRYDWDLEFWWQLDGDYLISGDNAGMALTHGDYWSGGRQAGWFEVKGDYARWNAEEMIDLADYLRGSVEYYESKQYVDDLAEMVDDDLYQEREAEKKRRKDAFDKATEMVRNRDVDGVKAALLGELRV